MKTILFIFLQFCLFSVNSFSQDITYKDLIGKWRTLSSYKAYYARIEFIDSSQLYLVEYNYDLKTKNDTLTYTLSVLPTNQSVLNISDPRYNRKNAIKRQFKNKWLIKRKDEDVLYIEMLDNKAPLRWRNDKNAYHTFFKLK